MKQEGILTQAEIARYKQQVLLRGVGVDGQTRLKNSRVAIVGLGGLGSPVAIYLAAAGVGSLTLIEDDSVSLSNLHRQILYNSEDVGKSKLDVALERLALLNNEISISSRAMRLDRTNATDTLSGHDVVVDCTDNFESRYAINAASVALNIPVVAGSVYQFEGQLSVFCAKGGPCYQCVYPEPPIGAPTCSDDGVLGTVPGMIGMLQATEVLKLLLRIGQPLIGELLLYDAQTVEVRTITVRRRSDCPICGEKLNRAATTVFETSVRHKDLSVEEYAEWLSSERTHQLVDIREEYERDIASIGGELIPMGELTDRLSELIRREPIVVYCHLGIRSRQVATMLAQMGYKNVYNLVGGIDRYSERIDPKVPRY